MPYNIYENLQTSETCISKASDLNAVKFGRVVKNAIVYNISNVWTCSIKNNVNLHDIVFDDVKLIRDQCLLNSKVLSCFSGVMMNIKSFFLFSVIIIGEQEEQQKE